MKRSMPAFILVLLLFLPTLAQKRQTDREADGFKGAVKTVITEKAKLKDDSSELTEYDRKPESEITYDANGNRLSREAYDYTGTLFESVSYSRVDGSKVAIYREIKDKNSIVVEMPADARKRRSDPRYTYKFEYKYDSNGNISEEAWYQSDSSLWLKYGYKLKGNQKEKSVYSADGSLNQKYVYTLDDKGNEIEMFVYDTKTDSVRSKEAYKYAEFDLKGNWTKRVTLRGDKEGGFALEPSRVLYRRIAYF